MRSLYCSALALCSLLLSGCWSSDVALFVVELQGEIDAVDPDVTVTVELSHVSIGEGLLETGTFPIDTFVLAGGGAFSYDLNYPMEEGRGLFIHAWADEDADGAFCAPGTSPEPSGGVLLDAPTEEPATGLEISLDRFCMTADQLVAESDDEQTEIPQ